MDEKVILQHFSTLLKKSKEYFEILGGLPQVGLNKKFWQPFFQKTFDIFSQLWKFQQEYRKTLDQNGLKRWEIGEIATRIAQLYYHYYLRTSDLRYLQESYTFYDAVRTRHYFSQINEEDSAYLLLYKKLRYYARFIVVCILLNKRDMAQIIFKEMKEVVQMYSSLVQSSSNNNNSENQGFIPEYEWRMIVNELEIFIKSDTYFQVGSSPNRLTYRIFSPTIISTILPTVSNSLPSTSDNITAPFSSSKASTIAPLHKVYLSQAILVENKRKKHQVRFSEMTLDMYRVMQSLEREQPIKDHTSSKAPLSPSSTSRIMRNPPKIMLYRPTITDMLVVLSNSLIHESDLTNKCATLIYISADASSDQGLSLSGTLTSSNTSSYKKQITKVATEVHNVLTFDDIIPFTRKPLFLIVESDKSEILRPDLRSKKLLNDTFVSIHSPPVQPAPWDQTDGKYGNMLTHFLTSPIYAFCVLYPPSDLYKEKTKNVSPSASPSSLTTTNYSVEKMDLITNKISSLGISPTGLINQNNPKFHPSIIVSTNDFETLNGIFAAHCDEVYKWIQQQQSSNVMDNAIHCFIENEITRQYIMRLLFCRAALKNSTFTSPKLEQYLPSIYPQIPGPILEQIESTFAQAIFEMRKHLMN